MRFEQRAGSWHARAPHTRYFRVNDDGLLYFVARIDDIVKHVHFKHVYLNIWLTIPRLNAGPNGSFTA